MIVEKEHFDIYDILRPQYFENIRRIKNEKTQPFRFGPLILHLLFHIIYKFPDMHPHTWTNDVPIMGLITKH